MRSDLIVMTFDGSEMAKTVYGSLLAMRSSQVLGLGDCVVMRKDSTGELRLSLGSHAGTGMAGLIANQMLDSPSKAVSAAGGFQADEEFVRAVVSTLRGGGSALLFYVDSDGLTDPDLLLNILALFRGKIHQTTLCARSIAVEQGNLY